MPGSSDDQALAWFDRSGNPTPITEEPATYQWPRLSPDGRHLAFGKARNVWVLDLELGTETRLGDGGEAVWTPDGSRVTYWTQGLDLYWQRPDGSAPPEPLYISEDHVLSPTSWTPDGRTLALLSDTDIWTFSLDDGTAKPLIATPAFERAAMFSPSGKYLAYTVRRVRSERSVRAAISGSGREVDGVCWRRNRPGVVAGRKRAVLPQRQPAHGSDRYHRAHVLDSFAAPPVCCPFTIHPFRDQSYDVSPDGQRFIIDSTAQASDK